MILYGACVTLYFGDTLYSAFVALVTMLHGACVSLYFGDTLYSGFVALATILLQKCLVRHFGFIMAVHTRKMCDLLKVND